MLSVSLIRRRGKQDESPSPGSATVDGSGVLHVMCRGCDRNPDFCDPACMRCVSSSVVREGSAERIRLTSVRDTEVSGEVARLICDMAHLMSPCASDPEDARCSECDRRPSVVMTRVADGFPDVPFGELKTLVKLSPGDDPECSPCLQRTLALLNRSESELNEVRRRASDAAGGSR